MGSWNIFTKNKQKDSKSDDAITDAVTIDFGEMLDISFAAKLHAQLKNEVKKNKNIRKSNR